MKRVLVLALLASCASLLPAQAILAPIAAAVRTQAISLPAETRIVSLTPADKEHPRMEYAVRRTFAADGRFTTEWANARYQSLQTFRPDGTLLNSKLTDLAKALVIETVSDPARSTLRTVISEKGAIKSDKKSPLTAGIALREEMQHLAPQAWGYGVRGTLTLQSLSPDGSLVGDFQIVFRPVADPTELSDKYTYPAEFRAALEGRGSYVVADMSLLGIASFFFPHHFYLVYAVSPSGLQFAAYFGEDPKAPVFQFVPR